MAHYGVVASQRRRGDLWRKTYWLLCWNCGASIGSFRTARGAHRTMKAWERTACPVDSKRAGAR